MKLKLCGWTMLLGASALIFGGGCGGGDPIPTPTPSVSPTPNTPPVETRTPTPTPSNVDLDEDGFSELEGDCDDHDNDVYPDAEEVPYNGVDEDCDGEDLADLDEDGYDGVQAGGPDCNDKDPAIHPGAVEIGDGEDNDCDGEVDDGIDKVDDDGDGFSELDGDCDDADPQVNPDEEEIPYNGVDEDCQDGDLTDVDGDGSQGGENGSDCNDGDSSVHPGAEETAYDGVDQDCNGADLTDVDGDGVAGGPDGTDCDDENDGRAPGLEEIAYDGVDQDCDGLDLTDVDGDGVDALEAGGEDCVDDDPSIYPGQEELAYDGIDQDCDGLDLTDVDGDGQDAEQAGGLDCDDLSVQTYAGAEEFADGKDNDCDGKIDEDLNTTDDDGDGASEADGDCDDGNPDIRPGTPEVAYDGIDQDCDGLDLTDVDEDGYDATVVGGTDCNDAVPEVNPGELEVAYDGIDQDCQQGDLVDVDGDGFASNVVGGPDCDDESALTSPDGTEVPYDGIDQDCSGADLTDVDGDGFDSEAVGGLDCEDGNQDVNPGQDELCDGIDNNCDDVVDTDAVDRTTFYVDGDHDGYGDPAQTEKACEASDRLVLDNTDCDDTTAASHPGASEVCDTRDNDCDGTVDEGVQTTFYQDADGDGYGNANQTKAACTAPNGYVTDRLDCNDSISSVNPAGTETCNLLDDDCDGQTDEGVKSTFYQDADGDGYGNAAKTIQACTAPEGYVSNSTDCKDSNDGINPGATELCNGVDENCNGQIDEGVKTTWYEDADKDRFGNPVKYVEACAPPAGYVADNTDCNDSASSIFPGAAESCNGLDDDCDTVVDDGVKTAWYLDSDKDGFGSSTTQEACTAPNGYVSNNRDCDDSNSAVKPTATEVCNGIDDDCDASVDEGVKTTYYLDADKDGYGLASSATQACSAPAGYVTNSMDCNDGSASVNPAATEVCNAVDDDCDTVIDEGLSKAYYQDVDKDGYGNTSVSTMACSAPNGYVLLNGDCNDGAAAINPAAAEVCDASNVDENCNGKADDADSTTTGSTKSSWYVDADDDGYGSSSATAILACDDPSSSSLDYELTRTDCDDSRSSVNPAVSEICDGLDTNCDGTKPTNEADADADGQMGCAGDCNDSEPKAYTGGTEICDRIDNNCDGTVDNLSNGNKCQRFNGQWGTSWETLAIPTSDLYSMMTYHPTDITHIYNTYGSVAQAYVIATNTWQNVGSTIPYSSPWNSMAPYAGNLYMLRNSTIYKFTVSTSAWSTVTTFSGGDDMNMTESDELGHIYGHNTSGQIVDFNAVSGTISYYSTGKGSQYETRMGYDPGTRAIFFGAFNAPYLYKFDLSTKAVTQMATIPEAQLNDIFCSDRSGHIYVAGNSSGTTMFQYDIATNTYKSMPALPTDHGNNGSCTVSETGYLYVGTGSNKKLHRIKLY